MANFQELQSLYSRGDPASDLLFDKVKGGILIVADIVYKEVPGTDKRRAWAAAAFRGPGASAQEMWGALMASGKTLTTAQILALSDATIQSGILAAVDLFAPTIPTV